MKILPEHINQFKKNGWVLIDTGIKNKDINKYRTALKDLRDKAIKINYPLKRCYYPHITNDNVSAIESPFNQLISNKLIKKLFVSLELGNAIKDLMGWEKVYLHLARLFTMKRYKYLGDWHRDFESWDGEIATMSTIQVGIYLKNQSGFRIVKPKFDKWGDSKDKIQKDEAPKSCLPLKLPKSHYSEINGKPGHVLFFAPGLMHQGNSDFDRLDFHLRFSKNETISNLKENSYYYQKDINYFDFNLPNFYSENFNIDQDYHSPRAYKINNKTRLINSLNYYTGSINILRYLKYRLQNKVKYEKPWTGVNLLSNTIFQK